MLKVPVFFSTNGSDLFSFNLQTFVFVICNGLIRFFFSIFLLFRLFIKRLKLGLMSLFFNLIACHVTLKRRGSNC